MERLSFEKLEVYQKAIKFVDNIFTLSDNFPHKLQSSLGDQLRRAGLSITNNIAEGSDKKSGRDKVKFYSYALDSARECISMLTIVGMRGIIMPMKASDLRENCITICKMLRKLIDSVDCKKP